MTFADRYFKSFFKKNPILGLVLIIFFLFTTTQGWAIDYNQFLRNKIKEKAETPPKPEKKIIKKTPAGLSPAAIPKATQKTASKPRETNNQQEQEANDGLDVLRKYQKMLKSYDAVLDESKKTANDPSKGKNERLKKPAENHSDPKAATRTPSSVGVQNSLPNIVHPEQKLRELLKKNQIQQGGQGDAFKSSLKYLTGSSNGENTQKPSEMLSKVLIIFRTMPDAQLRSTFTNKIEGTFLEEWSVKYPKVIEFLVVLLKDENTLPSLARVIDERNKLIIFFICNVLMFIGAIIWKRYDRKIEKTYFQRIFGGIRFIFIYWGARIGLLVLFFKEQLTPFGHLFMGHFFS